MFNLIRPISLCMLMCLGVACIPNDKVEPYGPATTSSGGTFTAVAHQTINEDAVLNITIPVYGGATCGDISASSSDTTLLPNNQISVSTVGATCVLLATPAANSNGVTTIELEANGLTSSFNLTVSAVNDNPSVTTSLTDRSIKASDSLNVIVTTGGGADEAAQALFWNKCETDNANVVVACGAIVGGVSTITLTSVAGVYAGDVTVTVAAEDSDGAIGSDQTLTLKKYSSCGAILAAHPTSTDTDYVIDPDHAILGPFDSYVATCDMAGGGWMKLIGDNTTTLVSLQRFGDTTNIAASYYNDPLYGVGWGDFAPDVPTFNTFGNTCMTMNKIPAFTDIKLKVTGFHDLPVGGLGQMHMTVDAAPLVGTYDIMAGPVDGQTLQIEGANIFVNTPTDIVNEQITSTLGGSTIGICMTAFISPFPYTQRFMQDLWIK